MMIDRLRSSKAFSGRVARSLFVPRRPSAGCCKTNNQIEATLATLEHRTIDGVVDASYTTPRTVEKEAVVAFVRRKGNTYFLVHNVRRQGEVQQLHLARLGERPRITDDVVRRGFGEHPFPA